MRKYILPAALAMAAAAYAGSNTDRLHISDLALLRSENSLTLNLTLDPRDYKVGRTQKIVLTPAIIAGTDTLLFDPLTVAGTQAWYYEVRDRRNSPLLARAGKGKPVEYSRTVDYQPWMDVSGCEIFVDTLSECACDDNGALLGASAVEVAQMNFTERVSNPKFHYVVPGDTLEKNFAVTGRADILFKVNNTDIDWGYAGNYAELDSILASVKAVRDNPDASVREILLTGYASPEGPYENNVRLAKGRTEAVKEYVRRHSDFPADIYHTSSVPEDWAGLREWLAANPMPESEKMIAFIDDPSIPVETKNDLFAERFPDRYPELLKNVYPRLRHTDYRITYNVRKYYDVEEIRSVMKTHPRNLSQNELYLLANSYPKDSKEYFEVFSLAARLFPADETANLNAANAAMGYGDLAAAEMYLERAGNSAQADYARGILAALNRDYDRSVQLLRAAKAAGIDGASDALDQIERLRESARTGGVTIL